MSRILDANRPVRKIMKSKYIKEEGRVVAQFRRKENGTMYCYEGKGETHTEAVLEALRVMKWWTEDMQQNRKAIPSQYLTVNS